MADRRRHGAEQHRRRQVGPGQGPRDQNAPAAASKGPRVSKVDPARRAAWEVLKAVRVDDAYANLALPQALATFELGGRDAAFATELTAGTIRGQGLYDAIIDACLTKPKLEAKVRDVLRLGVHQVLAMRVPDHAAIDSAVELARERIGVGPTGLVNAVLRKVVAQDLDAWIAQVAPSAKKDPNGHLAIATSHPRWVVEELRSALYGHGVSTDELPDLLAADNASPRVTLVARPGLVEVDELVEAGAEPTGRSPYALTWTGGDLMSLPAVVQGRAGVQDEGSQRVVLTMVETPVEGRDERWLDLCAGPGGKTALLASLAVPRGAKVLAAESQHHRSKLVSHGVRAIAAGMAGIVTADGLVPAWRPDTFDRVLVDAPCSGLGALRRRPESRWRRTPADVLDLVALQKGLLATALEAVRPGGIVVYATCSPVIAETSEVVAAVLAGREDVTSEQVTQLWPHTDGCDAMFSAVLRKE